MVDENKQTAGNPGEGNKPQSSDKIERAELAVKRMEEAEKRLNEKIAQLQELEVNRLLGSTAGGHVEPQPVKVETAKEYAERVMNNTIKPQ
jgi:hypothetical protein